MGLKRKIKFRPWTAPAMKSLRSMKRLRGTPLDPFGRAEVRRTERALIDEYVALVRSLLPTLATDHARGGVDRRARRSDPGLRVGEDAQRRAVPRGGRGGHTPDLTGLDNRVDVSTLRSRRVATCQTRLTRSLSSALAQSHPLITSARPPGVRPARSRFSTSSIAWHRRPATHGTAVFTSATLSRSHGLAPRRRRQASSLPGQLTRDSSTTAS